MSAPIHGTLDNGKIHRPGVASGGGSNSSNTRVIEGSFDRRDGHSNLVRLKTVRSSYRLIIFLQVASLLKMQERKPTILYILLCLIFRGKLPCHQTLYLVMVQIFVKGVDANVMLFNGC